MRFLWLGVKSPPQWQMSAWFSLPQQWLITTWNKQTSTILAQKSAAVLSHCYRSKDKIPRTLKRLYVNCCDFFYAEDFVGRIGIMLNITPLPSPDIFYNRASRSQRGKILWWNKHAGHQADPVSVHCLQTNETPRDKMRIRFGCSTTHGRAKLVPHWIPQFHQTFSSSASKTKTEKKFSCVFVRTRRRAKAKLVNNKSELAIKITDQEQFASVACTSLSFNY